MKKKIFLVSALAIIAMSAMFVACSDKNGASNGCDCLIKDSYGSGREHFDKGDMAQIGASTCGELAAAIRGMYGSQGQYVSVSCE